MRLLNVDFLEAALALWIIPDEAALSNALEVFVKSSAAFFLSFFSIAAFKCATRFFNALLLSLFRAVITSVCLFLLI